MLQICSGAPSEGDTYLVKDWGQMTVPEIWVMNATIKKRVTGFLFDVYRAALWDTDGEDKINITGPLTACPFIVSQPLWQALRNQKSAIYLGEIGKIAIP